MKGDDKLMQHVDGLPLIARQARMARAATDAKVIVALPPAPHPRYAALEGVPVTLCPVKDASEGMNASLRQAMTHLPDTAPAVMLLLADLPDLTEADLRAVLDAVDVTTDTRVWRGTTESGAPGHPVVFHKNLFAALEQLSGDSGGREVVQQAADRVTLIPLPHTHARNDLDTPEDWAAWRVQNPDRR